MKKFVCRTFLRKYGFRSLSESSASKNVSPQTTVFTISDFIALKYVFPQILVFKYQFGSLSESFPPKDCFSSKSVIAHFQFFASRVHE